jgi:hypothetical protein
MDASSVYPVDVGPTVLGEVWATKAVRTGTRTTWRLGPGKVQIIAHGERALQVGSATRLAWTRPR